MSAKQPGDVPDDENSDESAPEAAPEEASEAPESDAPEVSESAPPPAKRKRKRATAAAPEAADRPLFAQDWPADPGLERLLVAFDRGNYAFVRHEAPKLAEQSTDAAVKAAALDLRRRIDPAPVAGILVLIAIGILVVLAGHYLSSHDQVDAPNTPPPRAQPSTR